LTIPGVSSLDATAGTSSAEPESQPDCPRCKDVGFLRADVPVGSPEFGSIIPCDCRAEEIQQARRQRLVSLSNLGPLRRLTFDQLAPDGRQREPGSQHRFRMALQEAHRFADQPEGWLVLVGPPGCGKTHLAAAVCNQRIAAGHPAIFCVVPDLLDHLRTTFNPASQVSYDELFESIKSTELLVLDDLGTQSSTPWAQEKLFQLLNHRYNGRLPTIITSSVRTEELDERLRARLEDPLLASVLEVAAWEAPLLEQVGGMDLEQLRAMTFESFSPHAADEGSSRSLRKALRLASTFASEPKGWLILIGSPGCGKTHLAAAICNKLQAAGEAVCFVTVPDLLDHLRAAYSPDSRVRYDRVFEAVKSAPVLILDDLGAHSSTSWAQEKLFQLFNYRYLARLPTVITTNLHLDDHDGRLRSRMLDEALCVACLMDAPAYRLAPTGRSPRSSRPRRG
jgi:DNA replication protein DnaC